MKKNTMDKTGAAIIKICIFSIILSLTALVLCGIFHYWNSDDTEAWSENNKPTIIIDAGHGGEDGGASSASGIYEKDLNLSLALSLEQMLSSAGYKVVMTRSDDSMLYNDSKNGSLKMQDLKNRVEIANAESNAVFVSIHMNKFSQEKYSGLQVFYSTNSPKSEQLAQIIQAKVKEIIQKENNREIKPAGSNIYLLDNIDKPAVLVECGFLSNPNECEKLNTESYRKELAAVIYTSVIEFLEHV